MGSLSVPPTIAELGLCVGRLLQVPPSRKTIDNFTHAALETDLAEDSNLLEFEPSRILFERGIRNLLSWRNRLLVDENGRCFESTKDDYVRLFVGLPHPLAAPWESVYSSDDRLVFQADTLDVRRWYRSLGLETAALYSEPDDHIGLEIEFICLALADNHAKKICIAKEFATRHPGRWVQSWNALVQEHAKTEFYCGLGNIAEAIVASIAPYYKTAPSGQGQSAVSV